MGATALRGRGRGVRGRGYSETSDDRAILENTFQPLDPPGLRLGTPAVASRGMGRHEMATIANWIDRAIEAAPRDDVAMLEPIAGDVAELVASFPAPGIAFCDTSPDGSAACSDPEGGPQRGPLPALRLWPRAVRSEDDQERCPVRLLP